MCTVVVRRVPNMPLRLVAIRDELVSRPFDDPDEWWRDHPQVIGGRDRLAGGSWCVSDIAAGTTALVLNRPEKRDGAPSRGGLPLAAVSHGTDWPAHVDHREMAAFTLLLAGPDRLEGWEWDGAQLRTHDFEPGIHFVSSHGIGATDAKAERYARRFETEDWRSIVTSEVPRDDLTALIVRHQIGDEVYATVFGQRVEADPGRLSISWSRTPWEPDGWTRRKWGDPVLPGRR